MGSGKVFRRSSQLLLNKFFNPSTPFLRKGRAGGGEKKKIQAGAELCQAQVKLEVIVDVLEEA